MFVLKRKVFSHFQQHPFYKFIRYLTDTYITSAVRTPVGLVNGSLSDLTVTQLSAVALKESLERVPCGEIQGVFLGSCKSLDQDFTKQLSFLTGLSIPNKIAMTKSGIQSVVYASQAVKSNEVYAAIGVESASKNPFCQESIKNFSFSEEYLKMYYKNDYEKYTAALKNRAFNYEMINLKKKGFYVCKYVTIDDEAILHKTSKEENFNAEPADGSSALILAGSDYVKNNNLTPLAKVISTVNETVDSHDPVSSIVNIIQKGLSSANCYAKDVSQWELDNFLYHLGPVCIKELNISPSLLNKNGSSFSMGHPVGMTGARIVTHLAHMLPAEGIGCAAACNIDGSLSVVVIQKLHFKTSGQPHLRLYTKPLCQLCEELKEGLHPFKGRFVLEEVNIEAEYNKKIKNLYKYEIPVLFLDGRFLCKHRIDIEYFSRRLEESEKARLK